MSNIPYEIGLRLGKISIRKAEVSNLLTEASKADQLMQFTKALSLYQFVALNEQFAERYLQEIKKLDQVG